MYNFLVPKNFPVIICIVDFWKFSFSYFCGPLDFHHSFSAFELSVPEFQDHLNLFFSSLCRRTKGVYLYDIAQICKLWHLPLTLIFHTKYTSSLKQVWKVLAPIYLSFLRMHNNCIVTICHLERTKLSRFRKSTFSEEIFNIENNRTFVILDPVHFPIEVIHTF